LEDIEQTRKPDPIDVHVGSRVRLRRMLLGMSQEELGSQLGLTFQQVQKYERGANRIGASRLYKISRILEVPVSFFFDDMPAGGDAIGMGEPGVEETAVNGMVGQFTGEAVELIRSYYRLDNLHLRKQVFELVKAVALQHSDPEDKQSHGRYGR